MKDKEKDIISNHELLNSCINSIALGVILGAVGTAHANTHINKKGGKMEKNIVFQSKDTAIKSLIDTIKRIQEHYDDQVKHLMEENNDLVFKNAELRTKIKDLEKQKTKRKENKTIERK